jgi:DNA polymerase-3 subunit delta'
VPFSQVIGHRRLVALLARSADRGAVPPSLLFAGPSGIGKRLVAIATAQALNCLDPRRPGASPAPSPAQLPLDACGVCAACSRIARGVHPDVPIIEPGDSGSIKIDAVRDIVDRAAYRPFEGHRRVVIIDNADALVPQAQNALLKTLEEPPSASMFILITARPDALLPTVQSRCPRLRFRPLGVDDVVAALKGRGMGDREARAVAANADGSIGRGLEASADDLLQARDVALRVLAQAAPSDAPARRIGCAKDLLEKTGGEGSTDRDQLATNLRAMASIVRDVALVAAGVDHRALANPDVESQLGGLAAFRGERGVQAFGAIDRALAALERNAGAKIVADWVVLQM